MSLIKAIALAVALAAGASPVFGPEAPIQTDPLDAAWVQELG